MLEKRVEREWYIVDFVSEGISEETQFLMTVIQNHYSSIHLQAYLSPHIKQDLNSLNPDLYLGL